MIIGMIIMVVGMTISRSAIMEFQSGSKARNLYEKWLHTRRVGLCIALEGLAIIMLTAVCMEKEIPWLLAVVLPISVVACAIILYFIYKHNPMKKWPSTCVQALGRWIR